MNQLVAGQSITRGQTLTSPNGDATLKMQADGNVVLYHGTTALWQTNTKGKPSESLVMQLDGNLVLHDGHGGIVWALTPKGMIHGSSLVIQDDGNFVLIGPDKRPVWSAGTAGNKAKIENGDFFANAVKTCARPFGAAIHFVDVTTGKIDKAITKIPFIGPALHAVCSICTEEYQIANDILTGTRLDHVFMNAVHREISDYKAVAPYVETVISVIPGVGPEISSGIAVGLDLASGQPITDAIMDGAAAAVPGGELAKMAFMAGKAAVEDAEKGVKIGNALLDSGVAALGSLADIPVQARIAITAGLKMVGDIASGQKPGPAAIAEGLKALPQEAKSAFAGEFGAARMRRKPKAPYQLMDALIAHGTAHMHPKKRDQVRHALKISIALAHARKSQSKMAVQLPQRATAKMISTGTTIAQADPIVNTTHSYTAATAAGTQTPGQHGYLLGMGIVQHKVGIFDIKTLRDTLNGDDKKGFDLAMSLHTGRSVVMPSHVAALPVKAKVGFYLTKGMMTAPGDSKAALMKTVASKPEGRDGAVAAIKHVAHMRSSWLARTLHRFGLG